MNKKETTSKLKKYWQKFWFIVWKDESFKGWIFSIIFLFILIKLIIFPGLSFITGTSLPLAIVESCSMYHQADIFSNFDTWWKAHESKYEELNLTQEKFEEFRFQKGFNKGDILFIVGTNPKKIKIGDVIIFTNSVSANPVIHRVMKITEENGNRIFSTIGDNNNGQLSFEKSITEEQILGRAVLKITPFIGWIKLIFYEPLRPENQKGFCEEN